MHRMEVPIAEPWWLDSCICQLMRFDQRVDFVVDGIFIATLLPFLADGHDVPCQHTLVPTPHFHCRMMLPSMTANAKQTVQDLQAFHTLFSKPLAIKHAGTFCE